MILTWLVSFAVQEAGFRPRRVMALDLGTGQLDVPDPAVGAHHLDARALACWLGEPVGFVDVEGEEHDLPTLIRDRAWQDLRGELIGAAVRAGVAPPQAPADLQRFCAPEEAGDEVLVTVTIASLRSIAPTLACVERILAGSWSALEVVIVDNDDDHGPLDAAFTERFGADHRVRWVHEPRRGLSYARNAGLAAARGEFVVFTDDDVRVDRHWLRHLIRGFEVAPHVACVTGAILPAELETPAQGWLEEYGGFHKGFRRQVFNLTTDRRDTPLYPYDAGQFGSGANMAFRRRVVEELGGFAVDLGAGTPAHGGEDLDILRRTVSAGHTVVYEPAALMWHFHRRSMPALRRQMFRYGIGLSATVTRWLLEDRRVAADIVARLMHGIWHVINPRSVKNSARTRTFPRHLVGLELAGIALGPLAYLRSRARVRRRVRRGSHPPLLSVPGRS